MKKWRKRLGVSLLCLLALAGGYYGWFTHRPQPHESSELLASGVTYSRFVAREPPCIFHLLKVELSPDLEFATTDGDASSPLPFRAETTSNWAAKESVDFAISADFHEPWYSNGILDYYPRRGDPVDTYGLSKRNGKVVTNGTKAGGLSLFLDRGRAQWRTFSPTESAISGDIAILAGGQLNPRIRSEYHLGREPRMAIGLDANRSVLFMVAVDGRQPNYSHGISLPDLGRWLLAQGVDTAINLDGGGSVSMVARAEDGSYETLNCPIDKRIVGRERAIANHLGLRIRRKAG